jgi:hypothetical protein
MNGPCKMARARRHSIVATAQYSTVHTVLCGARYSSQKGRRPRILNLWTKFKIGQFISAQTGPDWTVIYIICVQCPCTVFSSSITDQSQIWSSFEGNNWTIRRPNSFWRGNKSPVGLNNHYRYIRIFKEWRKKSERRIYRNSLASSPQMRRQGPSSARVISTVPYDCNNICNTCFRTPDSFWKALAGLTTSHHHGIVWTRGVAAVAVPPPCFSGFV